jgi:hypothetical protein
MKLLKINAILVTLFSICTLTLSAQTPMKGVMREGNMVIFTGTVIEATKEDSLWVDAGISTYKFPIQEETKVLDKRGRLISIDLFGKGGR